MGAFGRDAPLAGFTQGLDRALTRQFPLKWVPDRRVVEASLPHTEAKTAQSVHAEMGALVSALITLFHAESGALEC